MRRIGHGRRSFVRSTVVVDSNVILRYLLADNQEQHESARRLFDRAMAGQVAISVPDAVAAECAYVLLKVYRVPRPEISRSLQSLLSMRGVAASSGMATLQALRTFGQGRIDFVDALVLAVAEANGWEAFSFDHDVAGPSGR